MIKAILFDADGVVIKEHEYFSIRYTQQQGSTLNEKLITDFFNDEYKQCAIGKADLRELLSSRIGEWGWDKSLDELLKFWFEGEKELDQDLIKLINLLKAHGIKCYLASDNELYRAQYLLNEVGLKEYFNKTFFSCFLGYTKSDPQFFLQIIQDTNYKPSDIAYFDDDPQNVETARSVGIESFTYTSLANLKEKLVQLGINL